MEKKTNRFIKISAVVMVLICIVVFVVMTLYMKSKTEESMKDIIEIYMSEMNIQLKQKFTSIINLRMDQVDGIVKRVPPESATYGDEMIQELSLSANIRGYTYLGLYSGNGKIEKLFGEEINILQPETIEESLQENGTVILHGTNSSGEKFLLLGQKAEYPMADGEKSMAIIAGVSMEYLNQALFLSEDTSMIYSHIIDVDGSYIIRNGDAFRNSYFEKIMKDYDEIDGKKPEDFVEKLKQIMRDKDDYYSYTTTSDGKKMQIYCSAISERADWYLISIMQSDALGDTVSALDGTRIETMIVSVLVILAFMVTLFVCYFNLSRKQIIALEAAKNEADIANNAKRDFLSSMSHDIRTPMNAIIGMTEIAMKHKDDTERVEDSLNKIKMSSKHLLGLINDILDISKIESGKMILNIIPASLRNIMDDIVNIVQPQIKAKEQQFDIFIHDIETENVLCDAVRLNQVLINLLSNAIKYTEEKGRIDVYLYQEKSELGDEYIRNHIIVQDNGIGMSEEFQHKIFDTFERENTEKVMNIAGTGLGMAITKHIIDVMGGTIDLESKQGEGSRFEVIIDLKKSSDKDQDMKLPPWNILVIDDNEQLCVSAASNLEEIGANAEWSVNGREAIEMIKDRHDKGDDYQFVLVDWKMPGMDGLETIREIHKTVGNSIPIFLISAYDLGELDEKLDSYEIDGFISKPLFKSTLYSRLSRYVHDHGDSEEKDSTAEISFEGKHVLIAEDIDLNWEIANELFSSTGMTLDHAVNGLDCVEKYEKSPIGFYDAILMDVRMPVMNGYEATKTIRASKRSDNDLPIIAMTADAFVDDARQCMESGMNAHLTKPLDLHECIRIFRKFL